MLISVSAVSAADLDDNNETVVASDMEVEKLSASNDVNAMDELNEDDTGSDDVLQSDAKSAAAGEKEILSVGYSDSDVLGAKVSKITIDDAYYQKIGSDYKIIVTGYVWDVDDEDINKGTVSIYLNDELKGYCDAEFGEFSGEVDVGPGSYNVRVRYHDDSGDYLDSQNDYYDNPIIIKPPEPVTWYVNGSKPYGGGGKSEADAFSTLNEALYAASNNDTVKIAAGTYAGSANIGGYIQKILTFEKYGDGEVIFDGQGQGTIWSVGVDTINIYGLTFINGGGTKGGALYFIWDLSNSVINATFRDNSVTMYGGAIYVDNSVSNLTLRSTFINNTANEYGAAVYIKSTASNLILNSTFIGNTAGNNGAGVYIGGNADNVKVYGEYRNNAASQGGVIYANNAFSSSVIDATFINNTAKNLGGAFCFNGDLTGVDISGKFLNNTGGDSIIYVANSVSGNSIHDSVFLNNEAYKICTVYNGEITAKDNWFGSDASNYYKIPEDVGIDLENWLFLNATADPSELAADEKSTIIFKLSSFDGSGISDYDASKMNIQLNLNQTLGELDKDTALLGEEITYTAKEGGDAGVKGTFETVSYTIGLTNVKVNPTKIDVTNSTLDLKVDEEVATGATLTPADAGNLTYTSSNSTVAIVENGKIKALKEGTAIITVSFAGNEQYAPAENKTISVTVSKVPTAISAVYNDKSGELVATLTDNVTGQPIDDEYVGIDIAGETYDIKTNSTGQAVFSTEYLPLGAYTATVSYEGSDVYNPSSTTLSISVKVNTTISAVYDDVTKELTVRLVNNVTGAPISGASVVVSVGGENYTAKINGGGKAVISLADLAPGSYTADISYNGGAKCNPSSTSLQIVAKANSRISAVYDDIAKELTVTLVNDATGAPLKGATVAVSVGGENYTAKINGGGKAVISLADLAPGSYTADISYNGGAKCNPSSTSLQIVAKANSRISAVYDDIAKELTVTLVNDATGAPLSGASVVVNVNGANYTAKINSKGKAVISLADLASGTYDVAVSFNGGAKCNPSSTSLQIVTKYNSRISAVYDDIAKELTVTLVNDATGAPLSGASVVVNVGGVNYTAKISGGGKAVISLADLALGTYDVTVSYNGGAKCNPSNTTLNILVKANANLSGVYNDATKEMTVRLVNNINGAPLKGATVVVSVGGAEYSTVINSAGKGIVSLADLAPGTYDAILAYNGGAKCNPSNATVEVIVDAN